MGTPLHSTSDVLIHACCGPCSLEPTRLLRERGFKPVIFYSNSNIHPRSEYLHRLDTLQSWASTETIEVVEGTYDPDHWHQMVPVAQEPFVSEARQWVPDSQSQSISMPPVTQDSDHTAAPSATPDRTTTPSANGSRNRSERCRRCYRLRFEEAARYAAEHGFQKLGTTLSVSPYQFTAIIEEELVSAARAHGVDPLFEDYRPFYAAATAKSRNLGMYRQNYCGCCYSQKEAEEDRRQAKLQRLKEKEERWARTAAQRAAEQQQREQKRAERQSYDEERRRRREILRSLRMKAKNENL